VHFTCGIKRSIATLTRPYHVPSYHSHSLDVAILLCRTSIHGRLVGFERRANFQGCFVHLHVQEPLVQISSFRRLPQRRALGPSRYGISQQTIHYVEQPKLGQCRCQRSVGGASQRVSLVRACADATNTFSIPFLCCAERSFHHLGIRNQSSQSGDGLFCNWGTSDCGW
jgi:hypothetical protein